jgi:hypothetical protein
MKRIVASVGLVALGACGLETASAQALGGPDTSKPWSVSATLRGFYDDNVSAVPNNAPAGTRRDTFGFEASPALALGMNLGQTSFSVGYVYALKYYDRKPLGNSDNIDQTHTFNAALDHAFTESYRINVRDSFVIGQEPDLLRAGNTFSTFQRVPGDNIRNFGGINFEADLTPQFGLGVGYDNSFYSYDDKPNSVVGGSPVNVLGGVISPTLSGLLDRIENSVNLNGFWRLQPETRAIAGYRFTDVSYSSKELLSATLTPSGLSEVFPKDRNTRMHTPYVGVEHNFLPDLVGTARVGATLVDYYNSNATQGNWSPYAAATLRYTYGVESSIEGGVTHDRNATDVFNLPGSTTSGSFTVDAESTVVYATLNHRIMPSLYGSLTAQFQNSTYNGGVFNNESEQIYLAGLELEYRFNANFSAHVGYDYDRLESDLGRTYDRNRVYMGVTARY